MHDGAVDMYGSIEWWWGVVGLGGDIRWIVEGTEEENTASARARFSF